MSHDEHTSVASATGLQSPPSWTWGVIVVIFVIIVLTMWTKGCADAEEEAEAKQVAAEQYAAAHPPAPVAPTTTTEALVLRDECYTPCPPTFVGWSYKIRTDGDPIRIKYNGCDWVDRPGKGKFSAPSCFQPGEAEFISPDEANLHILVQVYEKVAVPVGR